eukprot:scaffold16424_cov107-Isochrysis_galbana.AAC.3
MLDVGVLCMYMYCACTALVLSFSTVQGQYSDSTINNKNETFDIGNRAVLSQNTVQDSTGTTGDSNKTVQYTNSTHPQYTHSTPEALNTGACPSSAGAPASSCSSDVEEVPPSCLPRPEALDRRRVSAHTGDGCTVTLAASPAVALVSVCLMLAATATPAGGAGAAGHSEWFRRIQKLRLSCACAPAC